MLWDKHFSVAIVAIICATYTAVFILNPALILTAIMGLGGLVIICAALVFLHLCVSYLADIVSDARNKRAKRRRLEERL